MRLLTPEEIRRLDEKFIALSAPGNHEAFKYFHQSLQVSVTVDMPTGELLNPAIGGFVWAWGIKGNLKTGEILPKNRFNAQGLEGKVSVQETLSVALNLARHVEPYRINIFIPSNYTLPN